MIMHSSIYLKYLLKMFVVLLLLSPTLNAKDALYKSVVKNVEYQITDLGFTEIDLQLLSKQALPLTYAPMINNKSQVIYNDGFGGVLWDECIGKRRMQIDEGGFAFFHAINQDGAVLASHGKDKQNLTWYLWPEKHFCRKAPFYICAEKPEGSSLYFRGMNEDGFLAGFTMEGNDFTTMQAFVLLPGNVLQLLCPGIAWDVSKTDYSVANDSNSYSNDPYLWHPRFGAIVLGDQLKKPSNEDIRYVDTVISDDNMVYGNFFFTHRPGHLQGYSWDTMSDHFTMINTSQMRINAINSGHIMVGHMNKRAVVRFRDQPPRYIDKINDACGRRWTLLEATGINDKGEIVGYGMVDNQTHIFLLKPN